MSTLEHSRRYKQKNVARGRCSFHPQSLLVPGRTMCRFCLDRMKARTAGLKMEVMLAYGGRCSCAGCFIDKIGFLTIDHVNNDGAEHRKQVGDGVMMYRWLKKNGYPAGFRVLCYNCNCGRAKNGGTCPQEGKSH